MPSRPAGGPDTVMFARFKRLLRATPFQPFLVRTTGGQSFPVPTGDHAFASDLIRTAFIIGDDGGAPNIHALHFSSIELLPPRRKRAPKHQRRRRPAGR